MNKTGTTAFQQWASANRKALRKAGLIYPETGMGSGSEGPGHHYRLATALVRKDGQEAEVLCRKLVEEVQASGCEHTLVSSEFLVEVARPERLARHLAGFDCKVIVYLRRHDFWVESQYNQAVKTDRTPSWEPRIEDFIRVKQQRQGHWFFFGRLLENWSGAFGKENVIVRPYRSLERMDIIGDILGIVGLDPEALPKPQRKTRPVNGSVSRRQLSAIDFVQRSDMAPEAVNRVVRMILDNGDPGGPQGLMPPAVAAALICENMADYQMIAREYLGRADGVLFDEPMPRVLGESNAPEPRLNEAEGMRIMAEMLDRIGESLGV